MTIVLNINNPDDKQYYSCEPRKAAIARYAQSRRDYNTWAYEEHYGMLAVRTEHGWTCGDYWATLERK